ncbi:MAG: hypothetical protein H6502_03705 [Candidatus Woesearchaeota archaeon]|nr:MAG: hypothetical protein H6502_03705 [Candidatus Woesearchaeota archaeon]
MTMQELLADKQFEKALIRAGEQDPTLFVLGDSGRQEVTDVLFDLLGQEVTFPQFPICFGPFERDAYAMALKYMSHASGARAFIEATISLPNGNVSVLGVDVPNMYRFELEVARHGKTPILEKRRFTGPYENPLAHLADLPLVGDSVRSILPKGLQHRLMLEESFHRNVRGYVARNLFLAQQLAQQLAQNGV